MMLYLSMRTFHVECFQWGEEQLLKQTLEEQILFFDPVYKQVIFATDKDGKPAGRYVDIRPGFLHTGEQSVEISLYAPGAETVEVDVFDCGKISLKKDAKQEGYWVGEVKEVEPGFHYVAFEVNGTRVINEQAPHRLWMLSDDQLSGSAGTGISFP